MPQSSIGNLVITRRLGEVFWVDSACVRIEEIRGRQVRLLITAPLGVDIVRDELLDRPGRRKRSKEGRRDA